MKLEGSTYLALQTILPLSAVPTIARFDDEAKLEIMDTTIVDFPYWKNLYELIHNDIRVEEIY